MRRGITVLALALLVVLGILTGRLWFQAAPPRVPAVLAPTPAQLVFGDVYVGTVATSTASWKSTTPGTAVVSGLGIQGPNAAQFAAAPATPLGNVSVTSTQATPVVTFSFAPTAEGSHQALATLQATGPVVPLGLTGNGRFQVNTGDLAFLGGGNLNPGHALDFGRMQVGAPPKTKQFRVANVGANAVQVTRVQFSTTGRGFTQTAPAVPFVIQPLQGVMVTITFNAPTFTAPPTQMMFTDGVTVHGQTVGNPATVHSFGTALCGVGFYPAEEPELTC